MNLGQEVYLAWVVALWLWRGPSYALWILTANMVATFAACGAMDMGWLDRNGATLSMMVIDFAAGAALIVDPGLSRLISAAYALNLIFYTANIVFGVSVDTTFAVVMTMGFLQLAAVSIGSDGGHGIRRDSRSADVGHPFHVPGRIVGLRQANLAQAGDHVSESGRR